MEQNWTRSISWTLAAEPERRPSLAEHNALRFLDFNPFVERPEDAARHEIETIYRLSYWMPYAPTLPSGIDYFFFDMAVTDGVPKATQALQRALKVDPDGHIGVITTSAIVQAVRDHKVMGLLEDYARQRYAITGKKARTETALNHARTLV